MDVFLEKRRLKKLKSWRINMGKFKNFFVGFALGVGTGILLAPKSGEDTRRELKEHK